MFTERVHLTCSLFAKRDDVFPARDDRRERRVDPLEVYGGTAGAPWCTVVAFRVLRHITPRFVLSWRK